MGDNQTIIIGVSGPSASGKSLLATTIYKEIGSDQVVVISEDSYYKDQSSLSMEERAQLNYDHPDAFEHDLLVKHLKELKKGKTVQIPIYDFKEHIRSSQTREVGRHR
ncbi:MAG TPA: uridine kinase, partial [Coxiellaceae bacterium]|nr:uridine kinase [Coxiellaceae bacterium]